MATTPSVVVVGAGAIGCSTAYHLARMGARVTVVDRDTIGSGASFHATGLLPPWRPSANPSLNALFDASLRMTLDLLPRLQQETGVDTLFQRGEGLRVALREDQIPLGRALAAAPTLAGAKTAYIEADEARRLEPRLGPGVLGALWCDRFSQVDAYRYTLALTQGAERAGAVFRTGMVTGLERRGGRVVAVQTATGDIPCDAVVLAMGAWSDAASGWVGMSVPVRPVKGQNMRLWWDGRPLRYFMGQIGWGHLIQRADGYLSVGSTEEEGEGLSSQPTAAARDLLMAHALAILPTLDTAQVVRQFAGPRPVAKDGLPIMGPVPSLSGVYLNTGQGFSGIFLAAASGLHLAELVLRGESSVADPAPFLPARFA